MADTIDTRSQNGTSTSSNGTVSEGARSNVVSNDAIRKAIAEAYAKMGLNAMPSINGPEGICYDFCWGLRVYIPDSPKRAYRIRYWELESERLMFDGVVNQCAWVQSTSHYCTRYRLLITDNVTGEKIVEHTTDFKGRDVLISIPVETVGDTLAWFPSVVEFQRIHQCRLFVSMSDHMRALLEKANPEVIFIDRKQSQSLRPYAFYTIAVSFDGNTTEQPYDWRLTPLHWVGANILGLDAYALQETRPRVVFNPEDRKIKEPYVCISTMASGLCKMWMNPYGWDKVVEFLKRAGYRVIAIDGRSTTGYGIVYQKTPKGAEDWTGVGEGKTLSDRAALLYHADFFIGLGSGLSWLSWAMNKPTVLISNFSLPYCEFHTPYRVWNPFSCHGCFTNPLYKFENRDPLWCPLYKGDPKMQYSCSLTITSAQVINAIKRIPEFQRHNSSRLETVVEEAAKTVKPVINDVDAGSSVKVRDGKPIFEKVEKPKENRIPPADLALVPGKEKVLHPGDNGMKGIIAGVQLQLDRNYGEKKESSSAKPKKSAGNTLKKNKKKEKKNVKPD